MRICTEGMDVYNWKLTALEFEWLFLAIFGLSLSDAKRNRDKGIYLKEIR